MHAPEKLTIDLTVIRDLHNPKEARHALAMQLFALAKAGVVELVVAPQGYRIDVDRALGEQLDALLADQKTPLARQVARVSPVTLLSNDLSLGQVVKGFDAAWDKVDSDWRSHEYGKPGIADRYHVETHLLESRDVFITDDRGLLVMCRRLREEHGFPIVAMGLQEFLESHRER
jgi:hypothetical protein